MMPWRRFHSRFGSSLLRTAVVPRWSTATPAAAVVGADVARSLSPQQRRFRSDVRSLNEIIDDLGKMDLGPEKEAPKKDKQGELTKGFSEKKTKESKRESKLGAKKKQFSRAGVVDAAAEHSCAPVLRQKARTDQSLEELKSAFGEHWATFVEKIPGRSQPPAKAKNATPTKATGLQMQFRKPVQSSYVADVPIINVTSTCDQLWKQVQDEGIAMIMGSPGSGKTSLMHQFSTYVKDNTAFVPVVWPSCQEFYTIVNLVEYANGKRPSGAPEVAKENIVVLVDEAHLVLCGPGGTKSAFNNGVQRLLIGSLTGS